MGSRFAPIVAFIVSAGLATILLPTTARTACLDYSGGLDWQTGLGGSSPDDYGLVAVDGGLLVTAGVADVKFNPPFFETFVPAPVQHNGCDETHQPRCNEAAGFPQRSGQREEGQDSGDRNRWHWDQTV